MTTYLIRRLLLIIPTLLGVTIVSFLIMQSAPGDPLLTSADAQGGDRAVAREAYLVQKRALGLDKPALLNFNGFRDFGPSIRIAAELLGRPVETLTNELSTLVVSDDDASIERRAFLNSLRIPDFEGRLADEAQHKALAQSIVDFVQVWCENVGTSGVAAAIGLLQDPAASTARRRGAIHVLNHLLRDPFSYAYSRDPRDEDTAAVTSTWRLWSQRRRESPSDDEAEPSPTRRGELQALLEELTQAETRMRLMEGLEQVRRADAPFFLDKLLGESTLAEKNVAALALRLTVGKPLRTDVAADAEGRELDEAAENWLAYYDVARGRYEPSHAEKLADVFFDTQYARLVKRLATFDFGPSAMGTHEPVGDKIRRAVKATAPLMSASELLIYLIAVPLGVYCAVHRDRWGDRIVSVTLFMLYSVPAFVAAMLLLLVFCYGGVVRWFPMSGLHSPAADEMSTGAWLLDYAWHAALPVVCLSLFSLAGLAMYARSSLLEVISADYIRTARGKGVSQRGIIWKHALRNALIPMITLFADFLPAMLGGSVLVEVLFSIPGMGRLSWSAIEQKDYPTLMALVYVDAIVVLLSILLADVLYAVADPRIRVEIGEERF